MRSDKLGKPLDNKGGAAAEFAIILPILLLLIIGIYEFGRLYWIQNTLQYAAEQAGRCIMAHTSAGVTSGTCAMGNFLGNQLPSSTATASTGDCPDSVVSPAPQCVTVSVTYDFQFNPTLAAILGLASHSSANFSDITLRGQSQVPVS